MHRLDLLLRLHACAERALFFCKWTCQLDSHYTACPAGKETPNNLRIKVNLSIGSTSFVLLGSDNTTELIRAGLDNLKSIVNMYPETLEVLAAVQAVGASSPEGTLLTTGSAHRQRTLLHSGSSKALEGDACLALLHSGKALPSSSVLTFPSQA